MFKSRNVGNVLMFPFYPTPPVPVKPSNRVINGINVMAVPLGRFVFRYEDKLKYPAAKKTAKSIQLL